MNNAETDGRSWGVLIAQHQREKHQTVRTALRELNVDYFIPIFEEVRIVSGRHVRKTFPLLGRYILFSITEAWRSVSTLKGVSGLMLTADFTPAVVKPEQIEELHRICVNGVYQEKKTSQRGFVYGQRVSVRTGPFAYRVGRYDGAASRNREAAFFDLFGREQRVMFKTGSLIAA